MKRQASRALLICCGFMTLLVVNWPAPGQEPQEAQTKPMFPAEEPEVPKGLLPIFWPDDNPYAPDKAELGWLLYFDNRLSSDTTVSCASCHSPDKAFTDGLAVSTGISQQLGGRSAPTVINRAFTTLQFWDGRSSSLEDQAKGPLANPLEMTIDVEADAAHKAVVGRLRDVPGYVERFQKVFGEDDITIDHVAKAIATFERLVLSGNSAFDQYKAGDESAMSEEQVRGMDVFFNKAACDACHLGFNFSDESFVNIGVGFDPSTGEFADLGRFEVTENEKDKGAFKTPTLRDIEHTGPYMHNGSMETLEEVIEHYDKGGIPNPQLDQRMEPLFLTAREKADLREFLKALSGEGWQHIRAPKPEEFPK